MKNNYLLLLLSVITINVFSQTAPLVLVNVPPPQAACNPGECTDLLAVYPLLEQTTSYVVDPILFNPPYPFVAGPGATILNAFADDVWSPVVNLPFNFTFYGVDYNKVIVGSNGVISFNIGNAGGYCPWAFNQTIPNPGFPILNAIYGVYQDTNIGSPPVVSPLIQNVNYYVLDTGVNAAPNRVFVANWNELPQFDCNNSVGLQSSQIVIHEGTNIIDIFVRDRTCCSGWNSGSGVIGIQNAAGTMATVGPGRNTGCWDTSDEGWQFTPNGPADVPVSLQWEHEGSPVGTLNQNPLNVCPTGPTVYTAIVTYTNPNLTTFTTEYDINIDLAPPLPVLNPQAISLCTSAPPPYTVDIDQDSHILDPSIVPDPWNYVVTYYPTATDAADGTNAITNLSSYVINTPLPVTIYVSLLDISGASGCINIRPFIIDNDLPGGTISYADSPYCSNITTPQLVTETTLTGGGVYSSVPNTLIIDANTGAITPSGSPIGTYTVTYNLAADPPCPAYSTSTTVQIIDCTTSCTVIASSTSETICIGSAIPSMTYTVTGGATGGSISAGVLPAGVTGILAGGVYTLSGTPSTAGTYNFTVSLNSGADVCTANGTIIVNAVPNAGVDGGTSICESSTTAINLLDLITGEQSGGTWIRATGLGGTFNAAAGTFTPAIGAGTSTFTYTVAGVAPCSADSSTATVNISAQPTAGLDGGVNICGSSSASINLFTLITGEQAGGTWIRNTGTGGTFNAAAGTFIPDAGAITSEFQYTVPAAGPCPLDFSLATVTISGQLDAGSDGGLAVCDDSTAAINLFNLITGEQSGGVWTRTAGSGGTFNAAGGTFTPAAGSTNSTFTYTLTGTLPCVDDASVATVTITAQPTAGVDGTASVCDDSTTAINLFNLITGEQTGGVWTRTLGSGGTFNAGAGTFTPGAGATDSAFLYTVTGAAPCGNDTSTVTIDINPQPSAGLDGGVTVCDDSTAAINLFSLITGEQAGGVWTRTAGSGGTFNAAGGTFTPAAGSTNSTFTYTLTGTLPCVDDASVATVTITAQPTAGVDGTASVCDDSTTAINLFNLITGEQTGGVWTRTLGSGGTFNAGAGTFTPGAGATDSAFLYTVTGAAPCGNDTSTVTIDINPQPSAGLDGGVTVCDDSTAAINLFSLITGEQAGGVWIRTAGSGGTFNAAGGTFTPAAGSTNSTFTYTLTGTLPCVDDASVATVTINPQPVAGSDGSLTVCESSAAAINLFSIITGAQPGGSWVRTSGTGGAFDALAGTFTPAPGATASNFIYTLTATAPCLDDTSTATINISAQPTAGVDGSTEVCDTSTALIDLFSLITVEQSGGVWTRFSGTGGAFNAAAGTFTPAAGATNSTFLYTMTATAPCLDDTSLATVTINAQPDAGADGSVIICDADSTSINLSSVISGEQSGGTWARTSGTAGTFDAVAGTYTPVRGATTSTFTYTLTGGVGCVNDSSIATITIIAQPDAGTDDSITVCDTSTTPIDLFSLIGGEQSGGTWTRTGGSGGTFNAGTGTFTPAPGATSSNFEYTLVAVSPCTNDVSIATVSINPQPDAGLSGIATVCDSSTLPIALAGLITGEQSGGTWVRNSGTGGVFNAAGGTFTPSPGATTSIFTYTIIGAAPCIDDQSQATININAQPNAGGDGSTSVCQTSTTPISLTDFITGEQGGGTWLRTSGTGGVFNAAAGTFTPSPGATTSTFTYTIPGVLPCIDDVSIATVNINLQPDAGVDGMVTVCDTGSAVISLAGLITGEQSGGTWIRTSGAGGVFNAASGTFTPAVGATGSTFTYTLTGVAPCLNDSSVATVNVVPQPNAGGDGSITVCESTGTPVNLFTLIGGEQAGGTWTRASGSGGAFNAAAGTFIAAAGTSNSTFLYTITGIAPCISDSSLATVNVSQQPDAGQSGNVTVCETSTTAINLFNLITGEQSGGTWTRTTGSGGSFNAGSGTFTPAPGAVTSTFTYTLLAVAPCVNDTAVATVNINSQPDAGTGGQITACSLSTTSINLFSLISGEDPAGTWTRTSGTGGSFNAVAGTFTPALGALTSTFTYTITGVSPCTDDSSIATVNITPAVLPAFAQVAPICYGDFLGALPTTSLNGITGTWSPALDNTAETIYTFTPAGSQCALTTTMTIKVDPLPVVSLPQDGFICLDNNGNPSTTFLLNTGLGAGYSFAWSGPAGPVGTNSGSYTATEPGSYSVVVTNTVTGCVNSAQAQIITSYPPQSVTAMASSYFSDQQIVTVTVFPAGNYEYQLDGGAFQDSNEFLNVSTGDHTVHVRDKIGCGTAEDEFTIIDYPKFFTPNNDGYNDTWNIFALSDQPNSKIFIFDRFGKLIKEMSPKGKGWDGSFNGKPLPGSDYWFTVSFQEEGMEKEFRAHFSLKR